MIFAGQIIFWICFCLLLGFIGPGNVLAGDLQKYFDQGEKAYERGDYEKAAQLYEKVVEIDPNYAPAYNALGLTYKGLNGTIEDVTWLFNVATEIDPNYIDAYDNQCKTYYQAQYYDEAEKACLKILSLVPNHGGAQFTLGWIYLGKLDPNRAVRYFEEVLKKIQVPAVYFGLGMAYAQSGDHAQVLDTVTQLRSQGQLQMASQLEGMIRNSQPAAAPMTPPVIAIPERQAGTLVPSTSTAAVSADPSGEPAAPQVGSMRVRLRGRLNTPQINAAAQGTTAPSQTAESEASGASRSAIDRIRELQRRRLGVIPQSSGY